jgi:CubicO group peptidase (beta-lactamase class C family)
VLLKKTTPLAGSPHGTRSRQVTGCWVTLVLLLCGCFQDKPGEGTSAAGQDVAAHPQPSLQPRREAALATVTAKRVRLDSFFRALHRDGFNGTVLVAQQGQVLYRGAFGYANFEQKDTLTTGTVFQLASVTKPFTALAIMLLAQKGQLAYQDSVQRFLPAFPYPTVTIRQLLTHSSGLPRTFQTRRRQEVSNQALIGQLSSHKPPLLFSPGSRFAYSNTGYSVLAALIEKVSGLSYGQFLHTRVFQPLGMRHTGVLRLAGRTGKLAKGYTAAGTQVPHDYQDSLTGDKGLYASAEDLYVWDQALYSEKLLKQYALREAFRGSIRINHAEEYGFGWRVRVLAGGERVLYHTGRWHGFRSYLMRNPRDRSLVVILSNQDKSFDPEYYQYILYPPAAKP